MCEHLVLFGTLNLGSVKTMLEMVCIWSFPAHRVGETYQGFLPRPMNFSQYVLDFWLQKCCQFVVCRMWWCDHPILGLHHVWAIRNVLPDTVRLHFRPSWPCAEAKAAGHYCQWHRRHPARIHAPPARHLDTKRCPSLSGKNPPAILFTLRFVRWLLKTNCFEIDQYRYQLYLQEWPSQSSDKGTKVCAETPLGSGPHCMAPGMHRLVGGILSLENPEHKRHTKYLSMTKTERKNEDKSAGCLKPLDTHW